MQAGLGTRNIAHGPEITTVCYEIALEAGRYFLGMQAGLGTRNIVHSPEITTVCYETEIPSRPADIFEMGSLVEPNVLCGCVRDRCTGVAHG